MKTYFKVSVEDVLNSKTESNNYEFLKTVGEVSCSIDYSRIECNSGIIPDEDCCFVILCSEIGYMLDRQFHGINALPDAVKWANNKLNNKYL